MMKVRVALVFGLLAVICLSVRAEKDPKSEPESAAEPEPEGEPEHSHHDEDSKHSGSSVSKSGEAKAAKGNNPASAPWAFSVPAILALAAVAKLVL